MNILLLNLTRFGDLLQSQAAISDLAAMGHRVAVVCLRNFAAAAGLLRGVSHVFPLQGDVILKKLREADSSQGPPAAGPGQGWHEALAELCAWRAALNAEFTPDAVCSLTPSLSARVLAFFLSNGENCSGFCIDEQGFGVNSNAWTAFMQGAALARQASPFNIVDMFRMIARPTESVGEPGDSRGNSLLRLPEEELLDSARAMLRAQAPEDCKGFVALQLGASEDRRRWPVEYFASLGDRLWQEEKLCPVLLGSKSEIPLAEAYAARAAQPYISVCGQTGLAELAAMVCAARLLVSNDTGTMHLAAELGIPVLGIFLATAQPFDTGPYQAGSCCLEPDMDCHPCAFGVQCPNEEACRRMIPPEFMASLALSQLRQGRWEVPAAAPQAALSARVWLSEYDDWGFMSLRSLSGHEKTARTSWLMMQRHFIRQFLQRDPEKAFTPVAMEQFFPVPSPERERILAAVSRAADLAHLLQEQGKVLTQRSLPLMQERFLGTWQKVHDTLRKDAYCGSLALLWGQETQAEGQDLPLVLERAAQFNQLLLAIKTQLSQ